MKRRCFLCGIISFLTSQAYARTQFLGQWDSVPLRVRKWYRTQMVPGGRTPCCNSADSTSAEEDRRFDDNGNRHYWTKFTACGTFTDGKGGVTAQCIPIDWMEVPDSVVLKNYSPPPEVQLPVVWWYNDGRNWAIRCYAPEPDA